MNTFEMVDLLGHYSKQAEQIRRVRKLAELAATPRPDRRRSLARTGRKVDFRLAEADLARLVHEYESGATGAALAERYGVARSTVIQLLSCVPRVGVTRSS